MAQAGGGISRGTSGALQRMIMNYRAKTGRYPTQDIIEGAMTAGIKDASDRSVQNRQVNLQETATMANIDDMNKRRKMYEEQMKKQEEANKMSGIGQIVSLGASALPAIGNLMGVKTEGMIPSAIGGMVNMGKKAVSGIGNMFQNQQEYDPFQQQQAYGTSYGNQQLNMGQYLSDPFGGGFYYGGGDWMGGMQQDQWASGYDFGYDMQDPFGYSGGGFDYSTPSFNYDDYGGF